MEITSAAVISLACLLSSGKTDQKEAETFAKTLTVEQVNTIQEIIDSKICLPKKFEDKIKPGLNEIPVNSSPTSDLT